jgi:hypothetical protein
MPNLEEIFFNSYKGQCCFLEVKSSNKIETDQYFKKRFFITSLRISRPNQNHMKQSDLGKSLDPTAYPKLRSTRHCRVFRPTPGPYFCSQQPTDREHPDHNSCQPIKLKKNFRFSLGSQIKESIDKFE